MPQNRFLQVPGTLIYSLQVIVENVNNLTMTLETQENYFLVVRGMHQRNIQETVRGRTG